MRRASSVGPVLVAIIGSTVAAIAARAQAAPTAADVTIGTRASRADSLAELSALEAQARREPRDWAAWHRKGMLAWALLGARRQAGTMSLADIHLADDADSSLRIAAQPVAANAVFMLDASRYLRASGTAPTRLAARGYANAAFETARRTGDAHTAGIARDMSGMIDWRHYEQFADRWDPKPGFPDLTPAAFESVANAAGSMRAFLAQAALKPPTNVVSGEQYLRDAETAFREAAAVDPSNERARRHLFMVMADRGRWDELRRTAQMQIADHRDAAAPWLALGLADHRLALDAESGAAFDSGFARLGVAERERLTRLTRLLPPKSPAARWFDSTRFVAADPASRAALERAFWQANAPIALRSVNPHHLEFLSRVVYAELRWTAEEFDVRGADTDRGDIFVRYGPPETIVGLGSSSVHTQGADFGAPKGRGEAPPAAAGSQASSSMTASMIGDASTSGFGVDAELWLYDAGYSFVFTGPPASGITQLAGTFKSTAELQRASLPVLWSTSRDPDEPDTVAVQTARFRAAGDSLDIVVSASLPIARLLGDVGRGSASVDVGMRVTTPSADLAIRDSTRLRVAREDAEFESTRSWRGRVGAGAYDYRVEGYALASGRGARGAATLAPRATSGFGTSDLLLAATVAPPASGAVRRWSDLGIVPNAGVYAKGAPIALLWETYALGAGGDSTSRYRVTVSVDPQRTGAKRIVAYLLGGVAGRSARPDGRSNLSYDRQARVAPASVDYLSLDLAGAPAGEYLVHVTVEDMIAHRSSSSSAHFAIVE